MAESSILWQTNGTGDGTDTGYTQAQVFEWLRSLLVPNATNLGGVSPDYQNKLAVSGTSSPVSVATGAALVYGIPYVNTAVVSVAIPTPSGATRIDRIVLRANYTAQTVRITRIAGSEGGAAPSLTQSAGTTWDIPLAQASITTAGVITVTDEREWVSLVGDGRVTTAKIANNAVVRQHIATFAVGADQIDAGAVAASELASGAVIEAKIGTGAVTETKLGTGAVTADKLGTGAVTEAKIGAGAVTADKLGAGAVTTAKLGDDAVDDTKAGNRVPQFYRRQGSNNNDWSVTGNISYTPTAVRMQAGATSVALSSASHVYVDITFPVAFAYPPLLFLTPYFSSTDFEVIAQIGSVSASGARIYLQLAGDETYGWVTLGVNWLAIGPE